ncbi:MAG: cation diffusion facilitator family transporter [Candidatus Kapabacteria bacterium]|nr:cation diffusion facilitator family transporter [Candidatus Kapabacteria bacterium]MCS7169316.1 cation diffusion facilitator family transporter [Candidatus Kapabacteria bacterium]MDW7997083.1 cation diffusion facilitator family transporter [Bacteroidota bacterium]MDW8224844.1 cation diffusion facilitator family transporter [Bacteroidota bacterium]
MNASLGLSVLILLAKWFAYILTSSVAIFSDALESIVHIGAVALAWYALRVSFRPPDREHPFGHFKVAYFSAGVEGGLIIIAAAVIIFSALEKLITGVELQRLGEGIGLTLSAAGANFLLGTLLVREGKRSHSVLLLANGKHVLTDVWTTVGTVTGLALAWWTGWNILDPLVALVIGANIVREGARLVQQAVHGLMDRANPELEQQARQALETFCVEHGLSYHRFRLREAGPQVHIDFHLQFANGTPIEQAHELATAAESRIARALSVRADIVTHLEGEDHPPMHDEPSESGTRH